MRKYRNCTTFEGKNYDLKITSRFVVNFMNFQEIFGEGKFIKKGKKEKNISRQNSPQNLRRKE